MMSTSTIQTVYESFYVDVESGAAKGAEEMEGITQTGSGGSTGGSPVFRPACNRHVIPPRPPP
jgi:hypothetical protein